MIIYLIRNLSTGMGYVGQTVKALKTRWACHCSSAKPNYSGAACVRLQNAMRKHGIESFHASVLEQCHTIEELNEREAWWIKSLNTLSPAGYNLRTGGGNSLMTDETRRKLSASKMGKPGTKWTAEHKTRHSALLTGRKFTPERCAAMSARLKTHHHNRGKPLTDEHKKKLSVAGKGRKQSPEWVAKRAAAMKISVAARGGMGGFRNPMFGRKQSAETISKIIANRRPPILTPELRAKYSAASKRRTNFAHSEETKLKMSAAAKRRPFPEAARIAFREFVERRKNGSCVAK